MMLDVFLAPYSAVVSSGSILFREHPPGTVLKQYETAHLFVHTLCYPVLYCTRKY